jgi:hypothetical protein
MLLYTHMTINLILHNTLLNNTLKRNTAQYYFGVQSSLLHTPLSVWQHNPPFVWLNYHNYVKKQGENLYG